MTPNPKCSDKVEKKLPKEPPQRGKHSVETTVAMELAASFMPLRNRRAVQSDEENYLLRACDGVDQSTGITIMRLESGVRISETKGLRHFINDAFDDIRCILHWSVAVRD
jgi:hypothetical protein